MTTLQEYLDQKYPTKEEKEKVKSIDFWEVNIEWRRKGAVEKLKGGELDLKNFANIEKVDIRGERDLKIPLTKLCVDGCSKIVEIDCNNNDLTFIDLSHCTDLTKMHFSGNKLTSLNFLNDLPNPEKLVELNIYNNNIQPTDIAIFSRFINLRILRIGTMEEGLKNGKWNKFYGSLKAYQNLTKLESICIEATDVDEGLEYLSSNLAQITKEIAEE